MNWKVRIKNKVFWITFIPLALALVSKVLRLFGIDISFDLISDQLVEIVEDVFLILGLIGVVNDPTTAGLSDSYQALSYVAPKQKEEYDGE